MQRLSITLLLVCITIGLFAQKHNMVGKEAKSWNISDWIDAKGNETNIQLEDFENQVIYILNYQSWCPGCHSVGLPRLKKLTEKYNGQDEVVFLVIQTVFEGFDVNTIDKNRETQLKYELEIPFGFDGGSRSSYPEIMTKYRTGGTPWVIILDKEKRIQFSDFHLENEQVISLIDKLIHK